MADSDHSTTLPFVTRRGVLAGSVFSPLAMLTDGPAVADEAPGVPLTADPALALWKDWDAAHRRTERMCQRQQRLEAELVRRVGFPRAVVELPDGGNVTIYSLGSVREILGNSQEMIAARARAEAEFIAHQARWDAADAEIGYSAALRVEKEAAELAQKLLKQLADTPATTVAGVAAKLDAVLREGASSDDCGEFPWPQIRSAITDLVHMARDGKPGPNPSDERHIAART